MGFINLFPKHFLNTKSVVDENITNTNLDRYISQHEDYEYFTSSYFHNKQRPRLVSKTGELNIDMNNVSKHKRRLLSDMFNTILEIKWRWHIVIFLLSFLVSWLVFAVIWYSIAYFHDDLEFNYDENIKHIQHPENVTHVPCVSGINDFTTALLYSIETQHTIGYGFRHITQECPYAIAFLMLQSCFGIFVQGLVAGVVFAKISRPNKRKSTIIFSKNAVISERYGKLCFQFKIGNIGKSQLTGAQIRILMIKSQITNEGEFIPFQTYELKVGHNLFENNEKIFFPWPKTIEHIIDSKSPMYEILLANNKKQLKSNQHDYEIVIILEGNIETTGASCHIRTSYLPTEILWGYKFKPTYPLITDSDYLFDYSKFNQVEPANSFLFHLNRNNNFSTQTTINIENDIIKIDNAPLRAENSILNSLVLSNINEVNSCLDIKSMVKTSGRFTIVPVRNDVQVVNGGNNQLQSDDAGYFTCSIDSSNV